MIYDVKRLILLPMLARGMSPAVGRQSTPRDLNRSIVMHLKTCQSLIKNNLKTK